MREISPFIAQLKCHSDAVRHEMTIPIHDRPYLQAQGFAHLANGRGCRIDGADGVVLGHQLAGGVGHDERQRIHRISPRRDWLDRRSVCRER